jgi:hypothetical protein
MIINKPVMTPVSSPLPSLLHLLPHPTLSMKYFRLQNFIDFFRWIVGRITVWYECLSECECTFEIDEEDCPTQPGRSYYRYFIPILPRLIFSLNSFIAFHSSPFLFLSLPLLSLFLIFILLFLFFPDFPSYCCISPQPVFCSPLSFLPFLSCSPLLFPHPFSSPSPLTLLPFHS